MEMLLLELYQSNYQNKILITLDDANLLHINSKDTNKEKS